MTENSEAKTALELFEDTWEKDTKAKTALELFEDAWEKNILLKDINSSKTQQNLTKAKTKTALELFEGAWNLWDEENNDEINKSYNSKLINEINSITIDGSFEGDKDFNELFLKFDDAISDIESQKWRETDKEKINQLDSVILFLNRQKQVLEKLENDTKNITWEAISKEYENIVKEIDEFTGNWPITVDVFWIENTFSNKAEAFAIVKEMKIQISEELKSWWRETYEAIMSTYWFVFESINFIFWKSSKYLWADWLKNIYKLKDGDAAFAALWTLELASSLWLGLIWISIVTSFSWMHFWPIESIYRRWIIDPLSKISSKMQYEDYPKGSKAPIADVKSREYKEFMEYKQRVSLMDMFNLKLETTFEPWTKEHSDLKNNIENLESFKLNKTRTFYYLANKIAKNMQLWLKWNTNFKTAKFNLRTFFIEWWFLVWYNPIKKGADWNIIKWLWKTEVVDWKKTRKFQFPRLWGFIATQLDSSQNLYSETVKVLNQMHLELNEWLKVFYENKESITLESDDKRFKTEVKWKDIKTDRFQAIIDYINNKEIPNTEKEKLKKSFSSYVDSLWINAKSKENIYKDVYILLDKGFEIKETLIQKINQEINTADANNNKKQLKLLKNFKNLINTWEWIWSKVDFSNALSEIKSNNKIKSNIGIQLAWIATEVEFNKILGKWFDLSEFSWKYKWVLFENIWENYEKSKPTEFLKNIENYISYKISDNSIETQSRGELNKLLNQFLSGERLFETEEKFLTEIWKILKWWFTQAVIIEKLNSSIGKNYSNDQKLKIKSTIEYIKRNPLNIYTANDIKTFIDLVKRWGNLTTINLLSWNTLILSDILPLIDEWKWLRSNDILSEWSDKLEKKFSKLETIINLSDTLWKTGIIEELNKLSKDIFNLENKYTKTQALYFIEKIQSWYKIESLLTKDAPSSSILLEDYITNEESRLKWVFDSLSLDDKIKYLWEQKKISNDNYKKQIILDYIEETISKINSLTDESKKIEKANELKLKINNELYNWKIEGSIESIIKISEANKVKIDKTKNEMFKDFAEINKKINFLKSLQIPKNESWFSTINTILAEKYWMTLDFWVNWRGVFQNKYIENEKIIFNKIQELNIERLTFQSPEQISRLMESRNWNNKIDKLWIEFKALETSNKTKLTKIVKWMKWELWTSKSIEEYKKDFIEKVKELRKIK